jgi:hypothetical protein
VVNAKNSLWLPLTGFVVAAGASLAGCELVAGLEDKEFVAPLTTTASVPARPAGARDASGKGRVVALAVKEFFYGTRRVSDRLADRGSWREIGFDLDGLCTKDVRISASNPAACKIDAARSTDLLEDGDGCRDNSFGRNVANNTSLNQAGDFDALTNTSIADGTTPTYVIVLEDYDEGDDDPYVPGTIYLTESTPKQDVEQLWNADTLRTLAKGTYSFPEGYRRGNTWVAGDPDVGERTFPFVLWERQVDLKAQMVVFTLQLRNGGRGGALGNVGFSVGGQVLGASLAPLITDLLLVRRLGADLNQCPAAASNTQLLLSGVAAFVDLAQVGPGEKRPVDNSADCSTLSVGLAFEAVPTQVPTGGEGSKPASPPTLCNLPPAGRAGASEASGASRASGAVAADGDTR